MIKIFVLKHNLNVFPQFSLCFFVELCVCLTVIYSDNSMTFYSVYNRS